jgi:hypothetical protein
VNGNHSLRTTYLVHLNSWYSTAFKPMQLLLHWNAQTILLRLSAPLPPVRVPVWEFPYESDAALWLPARSEGPGVAVSLFPHQECSWAGHLGTEAIT